MENLWAEYDNGLSLPDSGGRAQKQIPSQQRQPSERAIVSSLRSSLLQDYVTLYCRSLAATRIYRHCYFIDGLSQHRKVPTRERGSGGATLMEAVADDASANSTPEEAGGVSEASTAPTPNSPLLLHTVRLEAGSSRHTGGKVAKEENVSLALAKEHNRIRGSWLEVAPALLDGIGQSPAFFLLNPFGATTFQYDDLAPLYQRTAPTELCLFISGREFESRLLPSLRTPEGASTLSALLRSDRWKTLSAKEQETGPLLENILELFLASMQRHFLSVQRIHFPGSFTPDVSSTLLFATRRQDSLMSMNDALCSYRRHFQEKSFRGKLLEEWFVRQQEQRRAEEKAELYARILQQGRAQRARRWPDLRLQLLMANFGQFTVEEYNAALLALVQRADVRCEWRRGAVVGEASRVPGNDDTLIWK